MRTSSPTLKLDSSTYPNPRHPRHTCTCTCALCECRCKCPRTKFFPSSRFASSLFTLAALLLAAGCAPKIAIAQSQIARDTSPAAAGDAVAQAVAGNSAFAFDLYQNLRQTESGN